MKKIVLLNITHGKNHYCKKAHFLPIAGGGNRTDITNDACGNDNISYKNKWYGEFSSLYWAWKNLKGVDIIGVSQYRRYLADVEYIPKGMYLMRWRQFCWSPYNAKHFEKELQNVDFIMSAKYTMSCSVYDQYVQYHPYPENIRITTEALRKIHPDCVAIWEDYLANNEFVNGYLWVTRWKLFDQMMEWLYPVLEEIEKNIDLTQFEGYQSKVVAYLYERLVPVFLRRYNYTISEHAMYYIEDQKYTSPMVIKLKNSKIWQFARTKYYLFWEKVKHS